MSPLKHLASAGHRGAARLRLRVLPRRYFPGPRLRKVGEDGGIGPEDGVVWML